MKIFQRSQKDFRKKLLEDLLKIFTRKSFDQNLNKTFSSKNLQKVFRLNSAKVFRRMGSRIDLQKRSP